MKKSAKNNGYLIPNLQRSFEVLEYIAKYPNGVSFMQLLDEIKISKTTLFRILVTLEKSGYVGTSKEGGLYFLSGKIMGLAHAALEDANISAESFDAMRRLRDKLGETIMLGVLLDDACVMIEQEVSLHDFNFSGKLGMKSPLHASAPGKALLAFLPADVCNKLFEKIELKRYTARTIFERGELEKNLKKIREDGFSTDDGEVIEGLRCAAAPIFNNKKYPIAVIWATGPNNRIGKKELAQMGESVKAAAIKISEKLGYNR